MSNKKEPYTIQFLGEMSYGYRRLIQSLRMSFSCLTLSTQEARGTNNLEPVNKASSNSRRFRQLMGWFLTWSEAVLNFSDGKSGFPDFFFPFPH